MKSLFLIILIFPIIFACKPNKDTGDTEVENFRIQPDTTIALDFIMGKFYPEKDPNFIKVPKRFANRDGHFLQKDTWSAFKKMQAHASKDSIELKIISSTRNFETQKSIWEAKWTGVRKVENGQNLAETVSDPEERALIILRYSSMPSTSRHHWGTDLDINALNNKYFESGKGLKEYRWLQKHAGTYGFCQPYTAKDHKRPNGYYEEKWHWSYIPLAKKYTDQASLRLNNGMITGFLGSEVASEIDVVNNYILGINQACK